MKHWKYRTHITGWIACLALLVQVTGCARSELGAGEGAISFSFEEDDAVRVKSPDAILPNVGYTLDIVDQKGDTVAHYDDHRTVRSIKLKEGVYTVHAEDNTETPETSKFGEPRYGGTQSVTVTAGQNTPVLMTCKLINVKVTVTEFEQEIKDNFPEYSLVIKPTEDYTGHDTLTFTQAEVDAGQEGWINQTRKGTFVLIFRAVNKQSPNKTQIYIRTIADAEPADFYRLAVTMNPIGDPSDGGAMFRLSVKTDTKEYEFPFGVKDHTRPVPVVSRADGGSIREPLVTPVDLRNGQFRLNVHADAGMQRLRIRHEDAAVLLKYGLPGMINLGGDNDMATDEAQRAGLSSVVTWGEGSVVGETDTWVDFSGLMNTATLDGAFLPIGEYNVNVEVYDGDNQMITQTVTLAVMPDMDLIVDRVRENAALARYVNLSGQWQTPSQPENLTFEYTEQGQDSWQRVPTAKVVIEGKKVSTQLTGLTPETTYEYRLVGDGVRNSDVRTFTTDVQVDLPNLNFDQGYKKNTGGGAGAANDVWMVNIPGQPEFWGTGNAGTKNSMAFNENATVQETSIVVNGNALKLESKFKSVVIVGNVFAAGNLFSGYFEELSGIPATNPEDQKKYVHFGRPYTGRPSKLRGWYRYKSGTINKSSKGITIPDELKDKPDQCQIYISLENWGGATTRPTGNKAPSLNDAIVVGYGEMHTEGVVDMQQYEQFDIPITYKNMTTKPTHIVLVATSSRWGSDFIGGEGSLLYIDEFELIWEPDELAGN